MKNKNTLMSGNITGLIIGVIVSGLASMVLLVFLGMFFDVLHQTYPTPIDGQIWNSLVMSLSLISSGESVALLLVIAGFIMGPLITGLKN